MLYFCRHGNSFFSCQYFSLYREAEIVNKNGGGGKGCPDFEMKMAVQLAGKIIKTSGLEHIRDKKGKRMEGNAQLRASASICVGV